MHGGKYFLILIALAAFSLPASASAAILSLQQTPSVSGVGDTVRVDILINSATPVNAYSGAVTYSAALKPIAVVDANSIITAWVTHPSVATTAPAIAFAGITPGGFSGDKGILFSVIFRANEPGPATISVNQLQVLRNDGLGTNEPTVTVPLTFVIASTSVGSYAEPGDTVPPEPFTVYLAFEPQGQGTEAYIEFSAVDKGSGVDHYQVAETRAPPFLLWLFPLAWENISGAPYVLTDQHLTSAVYVRAVDRAGNIRLSVLPRERLLTAYEWGALAVILLLVAVLAYAKWGRRRK